MCSGPWISITMMCCSCVFQLDDPRAQVPGSQLQRAGWGAVPGAEVAHVFGLAQLPQVLSVLPAVWHGTTAVVAFYASKGFNFMGLSLVPPIDLLFHTSGYTDLSVIVMKTQHFARSPCYFSSFLKIVFINEYIHFKKLSYTKWYYFSPPHKFARLPRW
jgi:hypothetical protein